MSEADVRPGAVTDRSDGDPAAEAETVVLPTSELPGRAGSGPAVPPQLRRPRAELRAGETQRKVPWFWLAAALVALALVGRGVVGAALGSDRGTPSAAAPTAAGTPSVIAGPVPSPSASVVPVEATPPTVAPSTPARSDRVTLPLATPSASATTSASAKPQPPALACAVQADVAMFWGGYNATLTVRNTGPKPVTGWTLTFRIGDQQRIVSSWGGNVSGGPGGSARATDGGFNATVQPGASVQVGFQAQLTWGGSAAGPSGFALNGVGCS